MSLIHEALKKVQASKEFDTVSAYNEKINLERHHDKRRVARGRTLLIFIFFIVAGIAGWWAMNRGWVNTHVKTVMKSLSYNIHGGIRKDNSVSASEIGDKNINVGQGHTPTAFEAAREKNLNGVEFYKQGKFSAAKTEFLSSLEIAPEYAEAYNNLGLTYKQIGDIKNAENSYKKAIQYKNNYPEAMNNYGALLDSIGDSKKAREYFNKAVSITPDYPDPYLNMAILLEKNKRFEEAIIYYEKFLSLVKNGDELLIKNVRERILYLNAGRLVPLEGSR